MDFANRAPFIGQLFFFFFCYKISTMDYGVHAGLGQVNCLGTTSIYSKPLAAFRRKPLQCRQCPQRQP